MLIAAVGFLAISLLLVFAPLIARLAEAHFHWIGPYMGTITLWRFVIASTVIVFALFAVHIWLPMGRRSILSILPGIGFTLVGWVVDHFGARWALGVGAVAGIAAAGVAVAYLVRHRHLRLFREAGRLRLTIHPEPADVTAVRVAAGERVT